VMEQQPGVIYWGAYNPSPAPGMVELWTWEAFSHGADVVSYFRWRQVPYAQEQMLGALITPNDELDEGYFEVSSVVQTLQKLPPIPKYSQASVAIVFDYEADWILDIQPQTTSFEYYPLVFQWYSTLRQLALNIDFVKPGESLDGYEIVLVPTLPRISDEALEAFKNFQGILVFGPRTGSKTENFQIPENLPPGKLRNVIDIKVTRVQSWDPVNIVVPFVWENPKKGNTTYNGVMWTEWIQSSLQPVATFVNDSRGAMYMQGNAYYLAFLPTAPFMFDFFQYLCEERGVNTTLLDPNLRIQTRGDWTFAFNYSPGPILAPAPSNAKFLMGGAVVQPHGVSVWYT